MSRLIDADRLIACLRNDRFETEPGNKTAENLAYRRAWNASLKHVEDTIIPRCLVEQKCGERD